MKVRYIFTFPTEVINKPLVFHLIKDFNLKVNIFNAYINSGEEGNLAVEIEGSKKQIEDGLKFSRTLGIHYSLLSKKINFDSEKCINCGACTSVCYSGALKIKPDEWKLDFDKQKCTVCELCTTACPLCLFKINFIQ